MDDVEYRRMIIKRLDTIIELLILIAFSTCLVGRAAVLDHGFWKMAGF